MVSRFNTLRSTEKLNSKTLHVNCRSYSAGSQQQLLYKINDLVSPCLLVFDIGQYLVTTLMYKTN